MEAQGMMELGRGIKNATRRQRKDFGQRTSVIDHSQFLIQQYCGGHREDEFIGPQSMSCATMAKLSSGQGKLATHTSQPRTLPNDDHPDIVQQWHQAVLRHALIGYLG